MHMWKSNKKTVSYLVCWTRHVLRVCFIIITDSGVHGFHKFIEL